MKLRHFGQLSIYDNLETTCNYKSYSNKNKYKNNQVTILEETQNQKTLCELM